ncbi:MAG TPA: hypothetical protein VFC51_10995, partial [Chloroflexota bacterium]|nr:hypothetical protein [Chloroflexota bacterium]
YRTPYAALKAELPNIDEAIRFPIPFLLDDVSVRLGPWSGYHLLAHHLTLIRHEKVRFGRAA